MAKKPKTITISYNGKDVKKEQVVPGLVKTGNAFLVRCKKTNAWTYCNQARVDGLVAKFGTIEKLGKNYVGRAGKRLLKAEQVEKDAAAEAEKPAEITEEKE